MKIEFKKGQPCPLTSVECGNISSKITDFFCEKCPYCMFYKDMTITIEVDKK